jgi:hypothetical protein
VSAATSASTRRESSPASDRAARAGRFDARRIDQVGDAFGLCEIEAIVEERAAREFSGLGHSSAELERAAQQLLHHDRAAMSLELDYVLSGIGMGRGKEEREAVVDRRAARVAKIGERGVTWRGERARHGLDDRARVRPGDAYDADSAAPRGRGDGGDGVRRPQRWAALAFASAARVRLMCHCCTIDSRFWTTQ